MIEAAGSQARPVWSKNQVENALLVTAQAANALACFGVPKVDLVIVRGGRHQFAVWTVRDLRGGLGVVNSGRERLANG